MPFWVLFLLFLGGAFGGFGRGALRAEAQRRDRRVGRYVHDAALARRVAKRRDRPYQSGRTKDWIKIKNPDAPAATRVIEG